MEAILGLVVIFGGIILFNIVVRLFFSGVSAAGRTAKAGVKAAVGKGTFKENMDLEFKGMGSFEGRITEEPLNEEPDAPVIWAVEIKGLLPLIKQTHVGFITSVFDQSGEDDELTPVLSSLENFQEEGNVVYQHTLDAGSIGVDQGFTGWVRGGVVLPQILQPPHGGKRNLAVIIRLVDVLNPPTIEHGFHMTDENKIIGQLLLNKSYEFTEKGYLEEGEHRDEARAIAIQMGLAVAMADGTLDDSEGAVIKQWITKIISMFEEEKKAELKEKYNTSLKEGFKLIENNALTLSSLTEQMNNVAEHAYKYEAIELCFDVMAADGVADPEELITIKKLAEAMELDYSEIEKMRDSCLVGLSTNVVDDISLESILGIESEWGVPEVKAHLRQEFQKWNNRLNTLSEGEERDSAQHRLDLIANARKKYN